VLSCSVLATPNYFVSANMLSSLNAFRCTTRLNVGQYLSDTNLRMAAVRSRLRGLHGPAGAPKTPQAGSCPSFTLVTKKSKAPEPPRSEARDRRGTSARQHYSQILAPVPSRPRLGSMIPTRQRAGVVVSASAKIRLVYRLRRQLRSSTALRYLFR
jgi:hypothetical protein